MEQDIPFGFCAFVNWRIKVEEFSFILTCVWWWNDKCIFDAILTDMKIVRLQVLQPGRVCIESNPLRRKGHRPWRYRDLLKESTDSWHAQLGRKDTLCLGLSCSSLISVTERDLGSTYGYKSYWIKDSYISIAVAVWTLYQTVLIWWKLQRAGTVGRQISKSPTEVNTLKMLFLWNTVYLLWRKRATRVDILSSRAKSINDLELNLDTEIRQLVFSSDKAASVIIVNTGTGDKWLCKFS